MSVQKPLPKRVVIAFTALIALSTLGAGSMAHAKIIAFFAAGTTCHDTPSVSFVQGGSAVQVSLCVTTSLEALCGATVKLQTSDARSSGRFLVTAVAYAPKYPDPNSDLKFPMAITNPPATADLGSTVTQAAVAAGARQLLATFNISPQPNAESTELSLAPTSSIGVSTDGTCAMPSDAAIAASIKLLRRTGSPVKK
jgi:hypothetical protein